MSTRDIGILITGARIYDGTGNPWFYGDVAISGGRIAEIAPPGSIGSSLAKELVRGEGLALCPGFIDILSHSIIPLMIDGRCLSKIAQGVTTEIMGEASTPAPFGGRNTEPMTSSAFADRLQGWPERIATWRRFRDWLEYMEQRGVSPNIGSFLGGGTLRQYVKGLDNARATPDELERMKSVAREAMRDGAFGVSYALIYPPDAYADTAEIIEICREVATLGGVYITHLRSEGDGLLDALDEAIEIGRSGALPVEIYHLKASGVRNWDKMPEAIEHINLARESGVDITADMYPYAASGTGLSAMLPPWAAAGAGLYENLRNPEWRARITDELRRPAGDWEAMGSDDQISGVMPVGFEKPENQQYIGKRLNEIAEMRREHWIDTVINLLLSEGQRISTIYFRMSENNLTREIQQPWMKISTDAGGLDPEWAKPAGPIHPRAYGSYPRVLRKYVREEKVISLEDAIRKMTFSVASRLGIRDRGLVQTGCMADLVLFDPASVSDNATFEDPHQLSSGIHGVWVNGVRVWNEGEHAGAMPGRALWGAARV